MENFILSNPTQLHFGKGVVEKLGPAVKTYGSRVLLMYGKGSVIKYGYYSIVLDQLKKNQCEVFEYSGIKPNPIVEDVEKAIHLAIENKVEVIVALGGGSVIDSAKIVSVCVTENLDPWQVMTFKIKPRKALPLFTILTLAATGTEMNDAAVLQNHSTNEKIGFVHPLLYPKQSFLDPLFTATVPQNQTANGIVDLIAHCLEAYFGEGESALADRFVFAIITDAMENTPRVLSDPGNYDYRARIMLDATCALNGTTTVGKKVGDWGVHDIGHTLSYLFDLPHGVTLAIAYPAWLRLHSDRIANRISDLGLNLFGVKSVDETIFKLEDLFISMNVPVRLQKAGVNPERKKEIASLMIRNRVNGIKHKLSDEDLLKIVDFMF